MLRPWREEDFGGATQRTFEFRIDPNRRAIQLTAASVFVVRLIIREFVTHVPSPSRKNCTGLRQVFGTAGRITSGTGVRPRYANQFSYALDEMAAKS
jgi:hypothetical protein